jgi:hypothetical protein
MSCGDWDYTINQASWEPGEAGVCKKCGAPVRRDPVTGKKVYQPPPVYVYPIYPPYNPCPQAPWYPGWWGIGAPYVVTYESSTYTSNGRAEDVAGAE